jgi:hypothetical protein
MEYKEIELGLDNAKHIVIDNGDGSYKSFPANLTNPEYVAFLESLNDNTEAE